VTSRKRKKLRIALRKNRQKKVRGKKSTRDILDDSLVDDIQVSERVSGKGDLTRRRTIIDIGEGNADAPLREVDTSKCLTGRVVSAVGQNSFVQAADGKYFECTVRRVLRTMAREARNAVVTGDVVQFLPIDAKTGVIERVEPRHGTISRGAKGKEHIIVANVDQVVIVASADDPPLKPNLIDRFLISAEKGQVDAIVCINKIDLVDAARLMPIAGLYAQLGYEVVLASSVTSQGIARLRELLAKRETVFTGQSGVGKSSLLNALQPRLSRQTSAVSGWTQKGRHTTRRAELLELEQGGWVVDTPGMRQFELWDVRPEEVEGYFVEFRPFVALCKFPDCTHTHEEHCGVKTAVGRALISPRRYESYLKVIYGEAT
jgi:ribosome biogenesis GTPase